LHLGRIYIESKLGQGSKFHVLLPFEKEHMEVPEMQNRSQYKFAVGVNSGSELTLDLPLAQAENKAGKLPLLLIVEDNSDLRVFIKNEFQGLFQVSEANDGLKGFNIAVSQIPDIIISDIMMPGMDGVELCKKLKEDEHTSHIPIILLTSRLSESQVLEGLETGADDYITKPFSTALLRARAQNLIKSRQLLRNQFSKPPNIATSAITPTSTDQKFIQKVFQIVEKYFPDSEFDAFRFASEIGMSRSQLYRKINGLMGLSVNELIRNIRLKKAAELLTSKNFNVTETASAVGFNDITYFIRCFSKQYGVTPSKYSASLKRN
jgi:DNA-binding response OmpR family regulator